MAYPQEAQWAGQKDDRFKITLGQMGLGILEGSYNQCLQF